MLSKNKIKLIRSLDLKKNRRATGLFIAEGEKLVMDLIQSRIEISDVICVEGLATEIISFNSPFHVEIATTSELERISFLKSPSNIVAVCKIPEAIIDWGEIQNELTLVLDEIQDPGNLGTIVRVADWFGIRTIICSENCADLYNPKVVQSTMGALSRVNVSYLPLVEFLTQAKQLNIPVYGAYLEGENLYNSELTVNGLLVVGNEGNGISASIAPFISRKLNIPSYPAGAITSESLNVASATSIIVAEFRSRIFSNK